jgi:DNA polymerase (family 10)
MAKKNPVVPTPPVTNAQVTEALHQVADLLEPQGANPFRISAYRIAAETVRQLTEPVAEILDRDGLVGLLRLDGVGKSLAHSIEQLVRTGHLPL